MNQPEKEHITFATGAKRGADVAGEMTAFPRRYDLLIANVSFMKRMAETFGEGSQKYGDENWKKGFEEKVLVNHMLAHLMQWISGDRTEDHLAHMTWNAMALMWVQDNRPDLLNLCASAKAGIGLPVPPPSEGVGIQSNCVGANSVPADLQASNSLSEDEIQEAFLMARELGRDWSGCIPPVVNPSITAAIMRPESLTRTDYRHIKNLHTWVKKNFANE